MKRHRDEFVSCFAVFSYNNLLFLNLIRILCPENLKIKGVSSHKIDTIGNEQKLNDGQMANIEQLLYKHIKTHEHKTSGERMN